MNKKPKDEPILAVTHIRGFNDQEDRCVLQVYNNIGAAILGEVEHLSEQGLGKERHGMVSGADGIEISNGDDVIASAKFFKLSQLKPGFAEKFS